MSSRDGTRITEHGIATNPGREPLIVGWGIVWAYVASGLAIATAFVIEFGEPISRLWWNMLARLL